MISGLIISTERLIRSAVESIVLVAAALLVNYNFFRVDMGFMGFSFNPLWLVIFFLAPRHRFPYGFVSSAVVAAVYMAIAFLRSGAGAGAFLTTAASYQMPALFVIVGYYLSLVREGFDRENHVLAERNAALEKQLSEIREAGEGISEEDRRNALKIFETSNTIKTAYQVASSLTSFNEDELMRSVSQLVSKYTESRAFAIYKIIEERKLIITEEYISEKTGITAPAISSVSDDPLINEAYNSGRIVTMVDIADAKPKHVARSLVKIACPINFKDTNEIYGFIAIFDMPFSRMNLETVNLLEFIAGWTQKALVKSREVDEMRSRNIEDELTLAYKYDYFKKRISEEHKRAQRYNFDLSALLIKIANYAEIDEAKRPEILRLFSIFVKTIVRDVDIVSRFKDENFLITLLPSTAEEGVMILIRRLKQALPAFLKNASLAPDAITMDFNYKVLFRRK